eukprot:PITA_29716
MGDSGSSASVSLVEDFNGVIKLYSDGSVVRGDEPAFHFPPLTESYDHVLYKDIVFNHTLGLWARLYLPNSFPATTTRLPVILYFHGGGFCLHSPQSPVMHRFCLKWAADVGALVVSSKTTGGGERGDPWFDSHADFSKVFLMGESAGGNIAHRLGMWCGGQDWGEDMQIKGLILLYPFYGGEARTAYETREKQGTPPFTVEDSDFFWRMALPAGSNRDHHFCNPAAALDVWSLSGPLPPTIMVIAGFDILRNKQLEYCELLKKCGDQIIEVVEFEEEDHDFALSKMDEQNSIKEEIILKFTKLEI